MTDNFHSKECATRHGSNECDCGYVKPLTKEQKEIARLQAELDEAVTAAREAVRIGVQQADEWDRFWDALGVKSADITVDQAIEKWKRVERAANNIISNAILGRETPLPGQVTHFTSIQWDTVLELQKALEQKP